MATAKATIQNEHGIHCRPSALIVEQVKGYPGKMRVTGESGSCDLRSTLELLVLGFAAGAELVIDVSGPDEEAFCRQVVELFERKYDFPHTSS